jgi:hypothetical protein
VRWANGGVTSRATTDEPKMYPISEFVFSNDELKSKRPRYPIEDGGASLFWWFRICVVAQGAGGFVHSHQSY